MAQILPLPTAPAPLRPAAQLFIWGQGAEGQFGTGPGELDVYRAKPYRHRWVEEKIASGEFGTEPGAGIESVAAGGMHSMMIDENGKIWTFGNNDEAALGRQTEKVPDPNNEGQFLDEEELQSYPHPVQSLIDEGFRAVRIVAGDSVSGAISSEGDVRVWGSFRALDGILGLSLSTHHQGQHTPTPLLANLPRGEKCVSLAAGTNHLLILTTHGNIYSLGAGDSAQLGRRILERRKIHGTVPEKVILGGKRTRRAVVVAAGSYTSFAVDTDGNVWGWGANHLGQLGTGKEGLGDDEVRLPEKVKGLSSQELNGHRVVEIAGGEHHTLFLTSDGRVYACGRAYNGQLGLSETDPAWVNKSEKEKEYISEPVEVRMPDGNDPTVHIAAGMHNSMAVSDDGALYAWGQGGAEGDEEEKTPKTLVKRTGGQWDALQVACGGQHSLGLFQKVV